MRLVIPSKVGLVLINVCNTQRSRNLPWWNLSLWIWLPAYIFSCLIFINKWKNGKKCFFSPLQISSKTARIFGDIDGQLAMSRTRVRSNIVVNKWILLGNNYMYLKKEIMSIFFGSILEWNLLLVFLRSAACRNLRETCLLALSFNFRFFIVSSSDYTKIGWSSNDGHHRKILVQIKGAIWYCIHSVVLLLTKSFLREYNIHGPWCLFTPS